METSCFKCGSENYPLTPVGYCYLCLSQYGLATQIAVLLLAHNPALSVGDFKKCLRIESRETAEYVWRTVRRSLVPSLVEEARNK